MDRDATLRTASDTMTTTVYSLRPDMLARQASRALSRRGFSGAPVIDSGGTLVGVVSGSDLIRGLAAAAFSGGPADTVEQLMSKQVETVSPDADLFAIADRLQRTGLRRLPVVVDGHLVGIVTRGDLMRALTLVCEERCGEVVGGTIDKVAEEAERLRRAAAAQPRA